MQSSSAVESVWKSTRIYIKRLTKHVFKLTKPRESARTGSACTNYTCFTRVYLLLHTRALLLKTSHSRSFIFWLLFKTNRFFKKQLYGAVWARLSNIGRCLFVLSRARDKETILSPHEESNLKPSDSALRCSTTESQRLYREIGYY